VKAQAGHKDGTASLVIAGIIEVLQIDRGKKAAPHVRGVESLLDLLGTVSQAAIAQQKTEASERKIFLMRGNDSVCDKDEPGAVVVAMPSRSVKEAADLAGAVHLGVSE